MSRRTVCALAFLIAGCDAAGNAADCDGFLLNDDDACRARPWPSASPDPLGQPGATNARIGVDADQQPVIGWLQGGGGQVNVRPMVAERRDGSWFSRALGSSTNGFADDLEIAVAPDGRVLASWTQHAVGEETTAVFAARRSERGGWRPTSETTAVSFDARASQSRPLLPATGESVLVWNQGTTDGYGVAIATATSSDDAFTRPRDRDDVLSPPVLFSNAPQIAVAANGDGLITWYQSVGDELRIFVSERRGLSGGFSQPGAASWISPPGPPVASHAIRNPVVAIDDWGHGLVVWAQLHPSGSTGLYAAERDGLGRWSLPTDIDDTFAPLLANATCSSVLITASGEAFVAWYDGVPGATSVFAAHRNAQGEWDEDWPAAEQLSTEGVAIDPQLASGADGEAVVAWAELREGQWAIFARRRNPGATVWGDPVQISEPEHGDALAPAVAVGSEGAVAIAWEQGRFGAAVIRTAISGY